jgi:hypothetical protein
MVGFNLGMENWQVFIDLRFHLHFKYPAMTPQGHVVEMEQSQNHESTRVLPSRVAVRKYILKSGSTVTFCLMMNINGTKRI